PRHGLQPRRGPDTRSCELPMPETKPTPELPSNDLILAALERAICHRGGNEPQTLSTIKQHLGLPHNGWTTVLLRPKLQALEAAGLVEQSRLRSKPLWGLTPEGQRASTLYESCSCCPRHPSTSVGAKPATLPVNGSPDSAATYEAHSMRPQPYSKPIT